MAQVEAVKVVLELKQQEQLEELTQVVAPAVALDQVRMQVELEDQVL